MKPVSRLLPLAILLLAACGRTAPTSGANATPQYSPVFPTLRAESPVPPSPSPARALTAIPTGSKPTQSPQPDVFDTARAVLTELDLDLTSLYSPNGHWKVQRILAYPITDASGQKYDYRFYTYMEVSCEDASCSEIAGLEWILADEWAEFVIGYAVPEPLGWSVDEKEFYFYDSIIPDGCQPVGGFQENLRRIDLQSGSTTPIPLPDWTAGMSLSPDAGKVAFYDVNGMQAGILDLESSDEQRLPVQIPGNEGNLWNAGDFTWSPDGQSLLFIIIHGDACFPDGSSLFLVDLKSAAVDPLIVRDERVLRISQWLDSGQVLLSIDGEDWWLNPKTGSMRPRASE